MGKEGDKSVFGELQHVGVVVKDINKTIESLSALGIGPFETSHRVPITERTFRGRSTDIKNEIRFVKMGHVEVELVQPVKGVSIASEVLEKNGEGVCHLGFFVDDVWAEAEKLKKQGFNIIQTAKRPSGGGAIFLDPDQTGGIILELVQGT